MITSDSQSPTPARLPRGAGGDARVSARICFLSRNEQLRHNNGVNEQQLLISHRTDCMPAQQSPIFHLRLIKKGDKAKTAICSQANKVLNVSRVF